MILRNYLNFLRNIKIKILGGKMWQLDQRNKGGRIIMNRNGRAFIKSAENADKDRVRKIKRIYITKVLIEALVVLFLAVTGVVSAATDICE